MAKKGYVIEKYAAGMFTRQEQYAQRVRLHYEQAVNELLALASQMPIDLEHDVFSFSDNPRIADETTRIIRRLYSQVYGEIKHGVEAEWQYANLSCDRLIESVFGERIKETNLGARWFQRNKEAMDRFFKRTQAVGGMNLSQRVWKYAGDLRGEMENAITVSLGEGIPAASMSRRVRQYLREPNKLFRRVRGSDGKLRLSKPAQLYHPGQGVYRSSYMNAMRLTRTETNAAYRAADEDRWNRLDFVVGFEVKKSNNHPDTDICDDLCGKYPKGFKFTAWHPQCRCFVVPILATPQEMANLQRIAISGGDASTFVSINHVQTVPPQFTDWISENAERIRKAKHIPYWIRDNERLISWREQTSDWSGHKMGGHKMMGRAEEKQANKAYSEPRNNVQPAMSAEQIENRNQLADMVGIPPSEIRPNMTHDEADGGYPNEYNDRENCALTVLAYEARRRGLDVTALPFNPKDEESWVFKIGNDLSAAWVNPSKAIPLKSIDGRLQQKSIDDATRAVGRYHLEWDKETPKIYEGKEKEVGHIIVAERLNDGTLVMHCPQTNEYYGLGSFEDAKDGTFKIRRVDKLSFNLEVVSQLLRRR